MDADLAFMINIETHHQSHIMLLLYISAFGEKTSLPWQKEGSEKAGFIYI